MYHKSQNMLFKKLNLLLSFCGFYSRSIVCTHVYWVSMKTWPNIQVPTIPNIQIFFINLNKLWKLIFDFTQSLEQKLYGTGLRSTALAIIGTIHHSVFLLINMYLNSEFLWESCDSLYTIQLKNIYVQLL